MAGDKWVLASLGLPIAALAAGAVAGPPPAAAGQRLFQQRCAVCHTIRPGAPSGMGPNLAGVVGRVAGTAPAYAYSPALRASRLTLDRAALDQYLAGPTRKVPGSRMPIAVTDPAERAAIVAYLASGK